MREGVLLVYCASFSRRSSCKFCSVLCLGEVIFELCNRQITHNYLVHPGVFLRILQLSSIWEASRSLAGNSCCQPATEKFQKLKRVASIKTEICCLVPPVQNYKYHFNNYWLLPMIRGKTMASPAQSLGGAVTVLWIAWIERAVFCLDLVFVDTQWSN